MNTAKVVDEINSYLLNLNPKQQKAVLTVVKTFAESQDDNGYSEEFKKELNSRYEDYLHGGDVLTQEDIDKETVKIIKGKKKK